MNMQMFGLRAAVASIFANFFREIPPMGAFEIFRVGRKAYSTDN
jgi:hypothetical protein